jgi:hypothetical protein
MAQPSTQDSDIRPSQQVALETELSCDTIFIEREKNVRLLLTHVS